MLNSRSTAMPISSTVNTSAPNVRSMLAPSRPTTAPMKKVVRSDDRYRVEPGPLRKREHGGPAHLGRPTNRAADRAHKFAVEDIEVVEIPTDLDDAPAEAIEQVVERAPLYDRRPRRRGRIGDQFQQPQDLSASADFALLGGLFDGFQDAVRAGGVAAIDTVRVDGDAASALERCAEMLIGHAHAHGRPVAGQHGGLTLIPGLKLEVGRLIHFVFAADRAPHQCAK